MNQYRYVNGNPIGRLDPNGLDWDLFGGFREWYRNNVTNPTLKTNEASKHRNLQIHHWTVAAFGNSVVDFGASFLLIPQSALDWGSGFGAFAGNPSDPDNQKAALGDLLTFVSFGRAKAPIAIYAKKVPSKTCKPSYEELLAQAKLLYPKKANKEENHHIEPIYMGGDKKGPTVRINAAYHQLITNAFRKRHAYGTGDASPQQRLEIMNIVYGQFPLPK